jgi:hypothetical protein
MHAQCRDLEASHRGQSSLIENQWTQISDLQRQNEEAAQQSQALKEQLEGKARQVRCSLEG